MPSSRSHNPAVQKTQCRNTEAIQQEGQIGTKNTSWNEPGKVWRQDEPLPKWWKGQKKETICSQAHGWRTVEVVSWLCLGWLLREHSYSFLLMIEFKMEQQNEFGSVQKHSVGQFTEKCIGSNWEVLRYTARHRSKTRWQHNTGFHQGVKWKASDWPRQAVDLHPNEQLPKKGLKIENFQNILYEN